MRLSRDTITKHVKQCKSIIRRLRRLHRCESQITDGLDTPLITIEEIDRIYTIHKIT